MRRKRFWIKTALFFYTFFITLFFRRQFGITVTDTEFFMKGPPWPDLWNLKHWFSPGLAQWRPVEQWIMCAEQKWLGTPDFALLIMLQGMILGLVAVAFFTLMLQMGEKSLLTSRQRCLVAIAASISFIQSIRVIEITWLIICKSLLAEFYVLWGLVAFQKYLKDRKWLWLLWVGILGFLGPLTRELPTALAMVVFMVALFQFKRDRLLFVFSALLMAHNVFPGFLPSLLLGMSPNWTPIFGSGVQRGLLVPSHQGLPGLFPAIHQLHFDLSFHIVIFFSSLAMLGLFASLILHLSRGDFPFGKPLAAFVGIVFLMALVGIYAPEIPFIPPLSSVLFGLMVFCAGMRFGPILPFLFICPLLPFIFVPFYDGWLRLPAAAYIGISLLWTMEIPIHIREFCRSRGIVFSEGKKRAFLYWPASPLAIGLVVAWIAISSFPNLFGASRAFAGFIDLDEKIAKFLSQNPAKKRVLISNLRQTHDIELQSDKNFRAVYLTFDPSSALPPDGPMPGGAGERFGKLVQLLKSYDLAKKEPPEIFFLFNDRMGSQGFPAIDPANLKKLREFNLAFPIWFLDPFQMGLPSKYIPFPAATDLMFQGNFSHGFFKFDYSGHYILYQYIGKYTDLEKAYFKLLASCGHFPQFWWDYRRFRIVSDGPNLYAFLPELDKSYEDVRLGHKEFTVLIMGKSLEDIMPKIDAYISHLSPAKNPLVAWALDPWRRLEVTVPQNREVSGIHLIYTGAPGNMEVYGQNPDHAPFFISRQPSPPPVPLDAQFQYEIVFPAPQKMTKMVLRVDDREDRPSFLERYFLLTPASTLTAK